MQGTVKDFKTEYLSRLEGGSTYTPKNTQTQTPTNDETTNWVICVHK